MKLLIASDHAGYALKERLIPFLIGLGHEVKDAGSYVFLATDDFPDFMIPVAKEVSEYPEQTRAILIGGSGQGEAMLANRFKNVRAAVYYAPNLDIVKLSRDHNNANVLCLGARFLHETEAKDAVQFWLETPFSKDERHVRRLKKIDDLSL